MGGYPKGRLMWEGESILERVIASLEPLTEDLYFSCHDPSEAINPCGVSLIEDYCPDRRGSLIGIYSCLEKLKQPLLVVAWDMPFLSGKGLRYLIERDQAAPPENGITLFENNEVMHPFPAVYHPELVDEMKKNIERGELGLRQLINNTNNTAISFQKALPDLNPDKFFSNINSPEDYRWFQREDT